MVYDDTKEQALKYARQAIEQMVLHSIPTSPHNFTIWYTYVSGRDVDLTKAITSMANNDQAFDEAVCSDLYSKFFTSDNETANLAKATARIEDELGNIQGFIGEAGAGAASVSKVLASAEEDILGAKDTKSLQAVVGGVLGETRKIEQINQKLEGELTKSTKQVNQLRDDLEDMRKQAMTDALTGIANRKMFDTELRRLTEDAIQQNGTLSLLMLDIDHFKKFNDSFGHQTGDEVLKLLAGIMNLVVGSKAVPARYGGEEFAVILPNTSMEEAKTIAEDIRNRIAKHKLVNRTTGQNLGTVTVSIGVGLFKSGEPLVNLVNRTDQSLYMAKSAGRNQVVNEQELSADALSFC